MIDIYYYQYALYPRVPYVLLRRILYSLFLYCLPALYYIRQPKTTIRLHTYVIVIVNCRRACSTRDTETHTRRDWCLRALSICLRTWSLGLSTREYRGDTLSSIYVRHGASFSFRTTYRYSKMKYVSRSTAGFIPKSNIVAARISNLSGMARPPPTLNNQQRQDCFTCSAVH